MDEIDDFLNIAYNKVLPQKGKVLISRPYMVDECFGRSVVLLTEYSEKGAVGFVLNKPLGVNLGELTDQFPSGGGSPLSMGGPVSLDTLHYLHTFGNIPGAGEVVDGIYWGGDVDVIRKFLSLSVMTPADIRFFTGYSGWSAGQLEQELETDSWLVGDIPAEKIIRPTPDLWKEALKSLGDRYKIWADFPENPALN